MKPIAVIGMGCRFPGANNPESFWQILADGVDSITEVPQNRWSIDSLYNSVPGTPGTMNTRWGGFLEEIDLFDASFFGISPREAECIDPQQRLLLEVTWEALENSGIVPKQLAGSNTGVFIGISNSDYGRLISKDIDNLDAYSGTGTAFSVAANRISYTLDLQGPSLAIDTACSSSLVAVHLACQSLQSGESSLCLVGGVNLIISPEATITFSQAQMMAPDGRCKTFDAGADGYVRGEGCGIVVLKPLEEAIKEQDNILAVIRGSAVNQDGLTNGITAPNGPSQQKVIRQALQNAEVAPEEISYVEAHGTGTALGDPVEVRSLKAVLMENREPEQTCWLGSVKTNIGHLESAAGVASLIKVILALQHREIPPHLHFEKLNPYISLEGTTLKIPTTCQTWETHNQQSRLAGISGFGFGGTNCHLIVQEYNAPVEEQEQLSKTVPSHFLLPLSAKTEESLKALASKYLDFLATNSEVALSDICFTASTKRSHFPHRLAVIADSKQQLQEKLSDFVQGKTVVGLVTGKAKLRKKPKVAFLFTGQGSQYVGMGKQLYDTQPTFRRTLDQCNDILNSYLDIDLLKVIYSDNPSDPLINETAYTQPALFALEYALAQLWISWGIEPAVVMGHSVGEYVAATIAGVFSLEDGLKLIAARGRLMQALPDKGVMFAIRGTESQAKQAIQGYESEVSIAAINGSQNIVISGRKEAVEAVVERLQADGVKTKQLVVSHAFHSPLMEPMLAEFKKVAEEINYHAPPIKLISNLTGKEAAAEIASSEYWCEHIREPVRFSASLETLHEQCYQMFVEIGAKPILLGMGRQCLPKDVGIWLPSLRPKKMDWEQMLQSFGELYISGVYVNWSGFYQEYLFNLVKLPTYPFQRHRYWIETSKNENQIAEGLSEEKTQNMIVKLLKQSTTEKIVHQLEKTGEFSVDEVKLLPKVLKLLIKQDQQQPKVASIKDWLYEIEWQESPYKLDKNLTRTQATEKGHWLIFSDSSGVGQNLVELLEQIGHSCILLYPGDGYKTIGTGIRNLNPTNPGDFKTLFQEAWATDYLPLRGIVHLWSLEANPSDELDMASLEQAQNLGAASVLHLLQSLIKHNQSGSPRLWLVTRGAQPVQLPKNPLAVAQAPLWGLGKVIALEHPKLWGGLIDLAPDERDSKNEAESLLAEILSDDQEDHVAFRDVNRYVARLIRSEEPETEGLNFLPDNTYLITGGLGALGLKVAQWMVEQGARYLVLTGRSGVSPQAQEVLSNIKQLGVKVIVAQADVSNHEDMVRVFKTVKEHMPSLRGIIHAAGVLNDGMLLKQDWKNFTQVMAPKVQGVWNLHLLTQKLSLDFFVLFSSVSSLLGSPGQGNYAAANAFMDTLAHYRHSLGLPGLSINWGPWAETGMAANLNSRYHERLTTQGMNLITSKQGLQALEYILKSDWRQIGVLPFDWSLLREQFERNNQLSLLKELLGYAKLQDEDDVESEKQKHEFLQKLETASVSDRNSLLITYIQNNVAKALGINVSQIDLEQPIITMGLDSLMAVELRNQFKQELELDIPIAKLMEDGSVTSLSIYLSEQLTDKLQADSVNVVEFDKPDTFAISTNKQDKKATDDDDWIEGEL